MNLKRRQELYLIRAERSRQRHEASPHFNQPLEYFLALDWPKVAPLAWRSARQARSGSDEDVIRHLAGINNALNLPSRPLTASEEQSFRASALLFMRACRWDRRRFIRYSGGKKRTAQETWRRLCDSVDGVVLGAMELRP